MLTTETVWIWTIGQAYAEAYARRAQFPVESVCRPEELIDFYGVRRVMHFDSRAHTPESLRAFETLDELVLSVDRAMSLQGLSLPRNLTGAIVDDLSSNIPRGHYTPSRLQAIYDAVKAAGPQLRFYSVIYTMNFGLDLSPYLPYLGVPSLWVWDRRHLRDLDRHLDRSRELFPGRPLVLGLYLYDYGNRQPLPRDLVEFEFRKAREYVAQGWIEGYQVLGSYRREELSTPEAKWVRDFLAG